ncbi:MAG: hypothetical protein ACLU9Q_08980 [Marvinbryantia sp.]|uniref:hypothetical protein n=1 Tax=Marvinbryantia sp. TaxID=2496532 RepID=UPI0025CE2996|nr:hypothetical protein [uncultured Marvinbryantia sp.]
MSDIHSTITDLPLSCKSAAEHMARELEREDIYANLTQSCCQKITNLEQDIAEETGEKIALVAYKL